MTTALKAAADKVVIANATGNPDLYLGAVKELVAVARSDDAILRDAINIIRSMRAGIKEHCVFEMAHQVELADALLARAGGNHAG